METTEISFFNQFVVLIKGLFQPKYLNRASVQKKGKIIAFSILLSVLSTAVFWGVKISTASFPGNFLYETEKYYQYIPEFTYSEDKFSFPERTIVEVTPGEQYLVFDDSVERTDDDSWFEVRRDITYSEGMQVIIVNSKSITQVEWLSSGMKTYEMSKLKGFFDIPSSFDNSSLKSIVESGYYRVAIILAVLSLPVFVGQVFLIALVFAGAGFGVNVLAKGQYSFGEVYKIAVFVASFTFAAEKCFASLPAGINTKLLFWIFFFITLAYTILSLFGSREDVGSASVVKLNNKDKGGFVLTDAIDKSESSSRRSSFSRSSRSEKKPEKAAPVVKKSEPVSSDISFEPIRSYVKPEEKVEETVSSAAVVEETVTVPVVEKAATPVVEETYAPVVETVAEPEPVKIGYSDSGSKKKYAYSEPALASEPVAKKTYEYSEPALASEPVAKKTYEYSEPALASEPVAKKTYAYSEPALASEPVAKKTYAYSEPALASEPVAKKTYAYSEPALASEPVAKKTYAYSEPALASSDKESIIMELPKKEYDKDAGSYIGSSTIGGSSFTAASSAGGSLLSASTINTTVSAGSSLVGSSTIGGASVSEKPSSGFGSSLFGSSSRVAVPDSKPASSERETIEDIPIFVPTKSANAPKKDDGSISIGFGSKKNNTNLTRTPESVFGNASGYSEPILAGLGPKTDEDIERMMEEQKAAERAAAEAAAREAAERAAAEAAAREAAERAEREEAERAAAEAAAVAATAGTTKRGLSRISLDEEEKKPRKKGGLSYATVDNTRKYREKEEEEKKAKEAENLKTSSNGVVTAERGASYKASEGESKIISIGGLRRDLDGATNVGGYGSLGTTGSKIGNIGGYDPEKQYGSSYGYDNENGERQALPPLNSYSTFGTSLFGNDGTIQVDSSILGNGGTFGPGAYDDPYSADNWQKADSYITQAPEVGRFTSNYEEKNRRYGAGGFNADMFNTGRSYNPSFGAKSSGFGSDDDFEKWESEFYEDHI